MGSGPSKEEGQAQSHGQEVAQPAKQEQTAPPVHHTYKLHYFDIFGRGEILRLCFALKGVAFEDVRVTFEEWPAMKPTTPLGTLPMIEVDGTQVPDSIACCRYLAREHGFYGCSALDAANIDAVCYISDGLGNALVDVVFPERDEAKIAELLEGKVPATLTNFEKMLARDTTSQDHFVGKSVTLADLYFLRAVDWIQVLKPEFTLSEHPKLEAVYNTVTKEPTIAAYIASRSPRPL